MYDQHVAVAASSWAVRTLGVCRPLPATGLATAATRSQIGHCMAGEQQASSVGRKAFCPRAAQSYSRWELAWVEPVYMWTSKAVSCHQLRDPEELLSHAVHLDDLHLKVTRAAQRERT